MKNILNINSIITKNHLKLLNKNGWHFCKSFVRQLGTSVKRPRSENYQNKEWWINYWTIDKMICYLEYHDFVLTGTRQNIIGVAWQEGYFPHAIGESPIDYLWRLTSTVLNTIDTFANISQQTFDDLGFIVPLKKFKF